MTWFVSSSGVSFSMVASEGDPTLMPKVAETLDRALATGKYDSLFAADHAKD